MRFTSCSWSAPAATVDFLSRNRLRSSTEIRFDRPDSGRPAEPIARPHGRTETCRLVLDLDAEEWVQGVLGRLGG